MPISAELILEIQEQSEKHGTTFSIAKLREEESPSKILNLNSLFQSLNNPGSLYLAQNAILLRNRLLTLGAAYIEAKYDGLFNAIENVLAASALIPSVNDQDDLVAHALTSLERWQTDVRSQVESAVPISDIPNILVEDALSLKGRELREEATRDIQIFGELLRLEAMHRQRSNVMAVEQHGARISNYYKHHFAVLHHPFDTASLVLDRSEFDQAIKFIFFIVATEHTEFRLRGVGQKFISALTRYLDCPRDSPGVISSAAEQIASVFEPFLKKCALLLIPSTLKNGIPVWHSALDGLINGLGISAVNLKESNEEIWGSRPIEDAILRIIYRLRNVGAHEAHKLSALEAERACYYASCAFLVASLKMIRGGLVPLNLIEAYAAEEDIRDLFPLIDDLVRRAHDSYNSSRRIDKLSRFADQARLIWPTTSKALTEHLRSELGYLDEILVEKEREDFLESLADDYPF